MSKSCWSISWDHQYRVYAVYLRMTFGGDLELLSCCCDTSGQRTLGDRLTSILEKIQVGEEDYLVLGGYMPECVIVERYFPPLEGRELEEAITFSSESCFPVARKKLKFTYNVLEKRRDGQQRVRIMAVLDKQLDKIFREMRKANVKADMLWHPFMAIGTELDNQEIFLPFIEPDCILEPAGEDGLRRVTIVAGYASAPPLTHLADLAPRLKLKDCEQPISGAYPSAVLLGAAMLRNSGRKNWRKPLLPPDLHRQRFRRFRPRYLNRPCRDVYRFVVIAAWGRDFRNGVFALRLRRPDQRGDQRARRVGFISAAFAASVGLDIGGEEGDAGLSARYGNFISVYRGGGVSSRFCVDFVQSVVRAFVGRRAGMRAEF